MRTWLFLIAIAGGLLACKKDSGEGPVPKLPPSTVARLAAQACTCTTMECIQPLRAQMERIIAAEHSGANAEKDHADATAKLQQCSARLSGAAPAPAPAAPAAPAASGW